MTGPSLVILAAGRARRYGGVKQLAPVGMHGEGVIDLIASDAYNAGFEDIVIVINDDTGPEIQEHVAKFWPKGRKVSFALQTELRGTVSAVLAAESALDLTKPFGVSNADDLYGRESFHLLGEHLATSDNNCLVGFELERALVGELPVSRGTCRVVNGHLTEIVERRNVAATLEGYAAEDGLEPSVLHPQTIVSMNLWGFQPSIIPLMHVSLEQHDFEKEKEIQLSTFVGEILHHTPFRFDVMRTGSRCIGVTHAEDLPLAQILVRQEIEAGERPEFAFVN
jgi:UTP-glucose-1-phosphate uridylyltransferase